MRLALLFLLGCHGGPLAADIATATTPGATTAGSCDCEATVFTVEADGVYDGDSWCHVVEAAPDETLVAGLWFDGIDWRTDPPVGGFAQRGSSIGYPVGTGCRAGVDRYRVVLTTL
jgi:hypothetical protein